MVQTEKNARKWAIYIGNLHVSSNISEDMPNFDNLACMRLQVTNIFLIKKVWEIRGTAAGNTRKPRLSGPV